MHVTRQNFPEARAAFLEHLNDASFLSFKVETTGTRSEDKNRTDLPYESYLKSYNAANKYALIQLGITIFKARASPDLKRDRPAFLQKKSEFDAFPFTFYLFPRTYDGRMLRDVGMEISTIQMNVLKYGMDWNQWLADGVGYVDREERAYIETLIARGVDSLDPMLKSSESKQVDKLFKEFQAWLQNKANKKINTAGLLDNDIDNDPKAFLIKDMKTNVKQALVSRIVNADPELFVQSIFSEEAKSNNYKVLNLTERAKAKANAEKSKLFHLHLNDAIGFSHLWDKMRQKIDQDAIPIVGHDCLQGLTFLFSSFESTLNKDYQWFKAQISSIFSGGIFDTRVLGNALGLEPKVIQEMHEELLESEDNYVFLTDERFQNPKGERYSTGYESYKAGFSFLEYCRNLNTEEVLSHLNIVNISPNMLYRVDFGSMESDTSKTKKVWVAVLREKEANLLRVKNNCLNKKGRPVKCKHHYIPSNCFYKTPIKISKKKIKKKSLNPKSPNPSKITTRCSPPGETTKKKCPKKCNPRSDTSTYQKPPL